MCNECELVAAVARSVPAFSDKEFGVHVWYSRDRESVDAYWHPREGRWMWVLRDKDYGVIKGFGYCLTARDALKTAFAAASFTLKKEVAPPDVELESPTEGEAATAEGRHYAMANDRCG